MRKLCVLLIACAALFAGCGDGLLDNNGGNFDPGGYDPDDNGNNNGGNQNSDVIGIWTGSYTYGSNATPGSIKLDISTSTWVLVFTSPGGTLTTYNGTWSRSGNVLTLRRDSTYYGTASASLSGSSLILDQQWTSSSYDGPYTSELTKSSSGGGEPLGNTTLRIRNESFIGITDVVWNSVDFTDTQNPIIRTGSSEIKNVTSGPGYIYFKREGSPIAVRTAETIRVEADEQKDFPLLNSTSVVEVSNPGNTATLQTFFSKPWIYITQDTEVIDLYGEYDFGGLLPNTNKDVIFTIQSIGGANLVLDNTNGSRVNLEENTAGYFSIIQQPLASTIAPGNSTSFTLRFSPTAKGNNFSANVVIKTNSQNAEEFIFRVKGNGRDYIYGDTGPGGGMIFYIEGGQYKECSGELGTYNWADAKTNASNYKGGGFTNWRLPDRGELLLMYQNLHRNNLGGFNSGSYSNYSGAYWSSTESTTYTTQAIRVDFYDGGAGEGTKTYAYRVRAVRSFTQ